METRGDVLIQGLWKSQTDAIIDVRFGDSDADTYRKEPMEKILARREKEKKDKNGNNCHEKRISPLFVLSLDGMLEKEALVVLTNLIRLMAEKLKKPLSHVRGWVNGRIAITVARSYSCMICHIVSHSPVRPGNGLGPGIGPRLSAVNCVPE